MQSLHILWIDSQSFIKILNAFQVSPIVNILKRQNRHSSNFSSPILFVINFAFSPSLSPFFHYYFITFYFIPYFIICISSNISQTILQLIQVIQLNKHDIKQEMLLGMDSEIQLGKLKRWNVIQNIILKKSLEKIGDEIGGQI
ncbi:unnamed protein product (macronuclear) [Paramecium tetraurelia]|uniref:Chromosome undetermined scaffold_50, whole genome shotgun sequence n=1 Tax=Paramecium tetraurelia TaxID=5888 RepID=A0DHR3_PARTE|nr:uncharacterized protein GSPATT00016967001 [Paramecium tetraurelia]XP_001453936.1 uncharacterized protein GSPATT00039765001 [Paramecium tetraurelia]CAK82580.1 unnamed protein product [Paramecium tetraurelia]CAK86539.1 unnamed protein product [Paramecium tetraurelia]|eukprot:XP_001449977.1 hypothetical protein (macronuclear) [Paramecium tetraurelia strain d4-2]